MSDVQDALLVRYLLGDATEEEKSRLEERFFADDDVFSRLLESETDLVDGYVANTLPARDRALFEARAAASPALAERVEIARALSRVAGPVTVPARPPASPWVPLLLAASVVLAAALGLTLRETTRLRGSMRALESSREELVARLTAAQQTSMERQGKIDELSLDLASRGTATGTPSILAFTLSGGLTRGQGRGNVLRIPADATLVALELPLTMAPKVPLLVRVETVEGKAVASLDGVTIAPGDASLRVTLPASVLPPGDYVVSASSTGARPAVITEMTFRVAR